MHRTFLVPWLANIALAAATLAFVVFALGPHSGTYRTLSILSDSMQPVFEAGDVVVVRAVPSDALRAGDIITYHAPVEGRPIVTHRIVKIDQRGERPVVHTRGDANTAADPWSARLEHGTAWRHAATIPNAGHVIRAMRNEHVKWATVYALPLLLVMATLASIWGARRADDDLQGEADLYDLGLADWACGDERAA